MRGGVCGVLQLQPRVADTDARSKPSAAKPKNTAIHTAIKMAMVPFSMVARRPHRANTSHEPGRNLTLFDIAGAVTAGSATEGWQRWRRRLLNVELERKARLNPLSRREQIGRRQAQRRAQRGGRRQPAERPGRGARDVAPTPPRPLPPHRLGPRQSMAPPLMAWRSAPIPPASARRTCWRAATPAGPVISSYPGEGRPARRRAPPRRRRRRTRRPVPRRGPARPSRRGHDRWRRPAPRVNPCAASGRRPRCR